MVSALAPAARRKILPSLRDSPVGAEVLRGLTSAPKTLSPWLFYDAAGSQLFEAITELPEYYLTRTERALFRSHADSIIARTAEQDSLAIVELGAGTATKTGLLLAAAIRRQGEVDYFPIDVSGSALEQARHHLERDLPGLRVHPRVGDYTEGLGAIDCAAARKLVLYIGSSIGNFAPADAAALLLSIAGQLCAGDCLLIGADQVKDSSLLEAAYDDAAGVTAAFNKNVLTRINRELGADFNADAFAHQAVWREEHSRVEMHLVSECDQQISIPSLDLQVRFSAGETIHTENSYKFTDASIESLLRAAGFSLQQTWKDTQGWFGVYLAQAG